MNKNLFVSAKNPNNHRERVLREDAQKILFLNETVIVGGTVRHFLINDLGLGVYEIGLAAKDSYQTEMAKRLFIPTLNDDGTQMFPNI
jgi:hypothetical protein